MKIFEHVFDTFQVFHRDIVVRVAIPDYTDNNIPLMIVHDAQNFFDVWEGVETKTGTLTLLDKLFHEGVPPFALVGIDTWKDRTHLHRFTDFSPWESSDLLQYIPSWTDVEVCVAGGRGDVYADFVTQEVLPFVENTYSIGGSTEKRGIGGSSMAAIASLYIGTKYNHLFSKFAFMSPALWCFKKEFMKYLSTITKFKKNDRVYLDIGRKESSDPLYVDFSKEYLNGADYIYEILKDKCDNILYMIDGDGEHNIASLRKHLPLMFRYLWEI